MAIQNARILMRGGNEADFDPDKMKPKEWAVSLDQRIVRICVAPGVCIRMATYDAFEADMAQIEAILEQTKSIQEAVTLINEQVSVNAEAVAEYTEEAKQYRDEAEQFRNEAEAFSPEGYSELVQNVEKNTVKIDTSLEKGGLTFDESASGEEIHVTDSSEGKAVEFALYGKARQNTTSGKNLLENKGKSANYSGIVFTVNKDKSVTMVGESTDNTVFILESYNDLIKKLPSSGTIILSGCTDGSNSTYDLRVQVKIDSGNSKPIACYNSPKTIKYNSIEEGTNLNAYINIQKGAKINTTIYPMISIEGGEYEPYTGGIASPNPDYPQEIEVAGASGSVEVKSVGENKLPIMAYSKIQSGINWTVNEIEGIIIADGTSTDLSDLYIVPSDSMITLQPGKYKLSGCHTGGGEAKYMILLVTKIDGNTTRVSVDIGNGAEFELSETTNVYAIARVAKGQTVSKLTFKPEIHLTSQETTATIPTPNGLPGIPVSSGGNYTDENGQQWICDSIVKYADGTGKYVQKCGNLVLDGTRGSYNESVALFMLGVSDAVKLVGDKNMALCTHYVYKGYPNASMPDLSFKIHHIASSGQTILYIKNTAYTDNNSWLEALSEKPVTVLYQLDEPIITDLSAEEIAEIEKLQTFYPVTNISNDAGCGMEIAYKADAKNYIDNIILARVATLETAVINNL